MTLLDSHRWVGASKGVDPVAPIHLWDFPSLHSSTVTSETLPSLSTSIEVRTEPEVRLPSQFSFQNPQDQQLSREGVGTPEGKLLLMSDCQITDKILRHHFGVTAGGCVKGGRFLPYSSEWSELQPVKAGFFRRIARKGSFY